METLPVEVVEMIVQKLPPPDLARCSAVCRKWHEICNQDRLWKPHCDRELEEPLRTTPSVATPAFVAPEAGNSTLSPITHWKLAFMRENHLWRNWRRKEIMNKKEKIIENGRDYFVRVDFFTDTLVVIWHEDRVEILDVSTTPATLVAKTDFAIQIGIGDDCRVIETPMLLVETDDRIQILSVDTVNKSIKLKHNINLDADKLVFAVKGDFFLSANFNSSNLGIIDMNTGKTLKEEPCPFVVDQNELGPAGEICNITSSPTCDFVAVTYHGGIIHGSESCTYFVYSLKEGQFLPSRVLHPSGRWTRYSVCLHGDFLAFMDKKTLLLLVMNFQTKTLRYAFRGAKGICVCYNRFVFWGGTENRSWVRYFSPVDKTSATIYRSSEPKSFKVIDNKFIGIFDGESKVSEGVLRLSGQTFERCDISVQDSCKINRSCTKVLIEEGYGNQDYYLSWAYPPSLKPGIWSISRLW